MPVVVSWEEKQHSESFPPILPLLFPVVGLQGKTCLNSLVIIVLGEKFSKIIKLRRIKHLGSNVLNSLHMLIYCILTTP